MGGREHGAMSMARIAHGDRTPVERRGFGEGTAVEVLVSRIDQARVRQSSEIVVAALAAGATGRITSV